MSTQRVAVRLPLGRQISSASPWRRSWRSTLTLLPRWTRRSLRANGFSCGALCTLSVGTAKQRAFGRGPCVASLSVTALGV